MAKVQDWLSTIPSPYTKKNYVSGLRKFEFFYSNPVETLIGSEDAGRIIEEFFVWLKEQGRPQNSCRNLVNAPMQFLKYFGTPVKYRKALGIYRTTATTRDHLLTIQEVQSMASVADLREQCILEVFLLGLNIGDASELQWQRFENDELPIHTKKENVTAYTFVSEEFRELLNKYLPLLDKSNPYLFQSKRKGHLTTKQLDNILKKLISRAGIKTHGLLRWHCSRKLFLRTCAELGIDSWSAKMMVGKAVSVDIKTYISSVQLKNDFLKVSNVLRLFPKPVVNGQAIQMLDTVFQVLRSLVEDRLKEQGSIKKIKPTDWQSIYGKLPPEEEEKAKLTNHCPDVDCFVRHLDEKRECESSCFWMLPNIEQEVKV